MTFRSGVTEKDDMRIKYRLHGMFLRFFVSCLQLFGLEKLSIKSIETNGHGSTGVELGQKRKKRKSEKAETRKMEK